MSTKRTAVVAIRYETVEHVMACDLDGKQESINDYHKRGLAVRWVTEDEAKRLMRQSERHVVNELNKALAILKRAYDVSPTGSTVEREVLSVEKILKKLVEEL